MEGTGHHFDRLTWTAALSATFVAAALLAGALPGFAADHPGKVLFEEETFGGNGRTCQSCHRQGARTISPAEAQALFAADADDPLFQGDAADGFPGDDGPEVCLAVATLSAACRVAAPGVRCRIDTRSGVTLECKTTFQRFLQHATIVAGIDLHQDVTIDLSDKRKVFLNRGTPTTLDTPALVTELMADGRAPTLQEQARGALAGHAAVSSVDDAALDLIAAFETTEFSSAMLESFAHGGPAPVLPAGTTESERRGRAFFVEPAKIGRQGFCGMCHSGPMLNEVPIALDLPGGDELPTAIPKGARFATAFVSERNAIGNPLHLWSLPGEDGRIRSILSPDIGRAAITGKWKDVNEFKIPSLWNAKNTAPFFHDNSAKTLEEMVDHYANFVAPTFFFTLTAEEKADIVAFMKLL
jgi:cytochrome c peroxidase